MNDGQISIFDLMYEKYKIKKPIKLIELFGGYGSQYFALKYLGTNVEHHKLVEWAVKSIQAYNDAHIQDYSDYSKDLSDDEVIDKIVNHGVSLNYNEPATREQIKRQNYRKIYNNIIATNNLVDISRVKGKDLEITDKENYEYIMTYSFPCQDLSLAGLGKGMKDTTTRSGLLWEVERILYELKGLDQLPQILLMENVPQVHGENNIGDFKKWMSSLETLGYQNYWQDLIATDYGIPQTRNRCFMVSILGEYNYKFPKPIPLKLKLKDMLENEVDEKYYLSDKMLDYMYGVNKKNDFPRKEIFERNLKKVNDENIAATITTAAGQRPTDNFILIKDTENYIEWEDGKNIQMNCRAWKDDKIVATLNTGGETKILIKNATKKGYLEATDGDGIDISSRMEYHRGNVQKNKIQTITTSGGEDRGVVVIENYMPSGHEASRILDSNGLAPTVKKNHGTVNATQTNNLRIRKLTPKECFRLMGVKDEDYENIAKNQSNASLYHLAGDSIVVNVLMAIFNQFF